MPGSALTRPRPEIQDGRAQGPARRASGARGRGAMRRRRPGARRRSRAGRRRRAPRRGRTPSVPGARDGPRCRAQGRERRRGRRTRARRPRGRPRRGGPAPPRARAAGRAARRREGRAPHDGTRRCPEPSGRRLPGVARPGAHARDELDLGGHAELLVAARAVGADGRLRDVERLRDDAARLSAERPDEDLALAVAELALREVVEGAAHRRRIVPLVAV